MSDPQDESMSSVRRSLVVGGAMLGAAAAAGAMAAPTADGRTDTDPRELHGQPMPEPPPERSAGPVRPGRGSALQGKVAVVTGAARGIGRAIAVEFAANGADVVCLDICGPVAKASDARPASSAELDETVRQVRAFGRRGEAVQADIRDAPAVRRIADQVEQQHGRIDILVANAAIQYWKPLLEISDSDWRDVLDNNLTGTANTIRAFAPKMVARGKGRIIVLSSMQGKHGTKDAASYSASKWGILGLMKSAALEFGQYNITVNALIPGLVDTPLTRYDKRLSESSGEVTGHKPSSPPSPQQAWDTRAPTVPLKVGWLQPDDISPAAVSWPRTPRPWSPARNMKSPAATAPRTSEPGGRSGGPHRLIRKRPPRRRGLINRGSAGAPQATQAACLRRRRAVAPTMPTPRRNIAQVAGSGTAAMFS